MSVIIVVRDGERWIKESITSVLRQTLDDLELIVQDDGSTDRTLLCARRAVDGDPRVLIVAGPPRGISAARNSAARLVRSDLIAVMDADDVALPHRLARQAAYLAEHPDVAMLGGWMQVIDAEGRTGEIMRAPTWEEIAPRPFVDSFFIAHPTAMMRRSVFEELGGYRPAFGWAGDSDLWARAIDAGLRLENLQEPLVLYRRHRGQSTLTRAIENSALMLSRELSRQIRRRGLSDPYDSEGTVLLDGESVASLPPDLRQAAREVGLVHELVAGSPTILPGPGTILRHLGQVRPWWRPAPTLATICLETAKAEALAGRRLSTLRWGLSGFMAAPYDVLRRALKLVGTPRRSTR